MKIICHRGNLYGPRSEEENTLTSVNKCLQSTPFDVEIDIFCINNEIYLGHDLPLAKLVPSDILSELIQTYNNRLWLHCKDLQALVFCKNNLKECNFFGHSNDEFVLTSKKYIFTRPGLYAGTDVICVMPELLNITKTDIINCAGILTDYPFLYS